VFRMFCSLVLRKFSRCFLSLTNSRLSVSISSPESLSESLNPWKIDKSPRLRRCGILTHVMSFWSGTGVFFIIIFSYPSGSSFPFHFSRLTNIGIRKTKQAIHLLYLHWLKPVFLVFLVLVAHSLSTSIHQLLLSPSGPVASDFLFQLFTDSILISSSSFRFILSSCCSLYFTTLNIIRTWEMVVAGRSN
jgi:hypothetical protein